MAWKLSILTLLHYIVYLKEIRALGRNMEQKYVLFVPIHEVGTRLWVVIVVKVLVTWHVHDFHLWAHEWILVVMGWHTNKTIKLFLLPSVFRFFKSWSFCFPLLLKIIGWGSVLDCISFVCMLMYFSAALSFMNLSFTTLSYCLGTLLKSPT